MCVDIKRTNCSEVKNLESAPTSTRFWHELFHHFPYATLSVASALMLLSMISVFFGNNPGYTFGMDELFHSFHFIHILFSVSGAMITFYRYSQRLVLGIIMGLLSAIVFCTLSDILLPYFAGRILGVDMDLHICFYSELKNIIPFLTIGVVNGVVMSKVSEMTTENHSLFLHFSHTFISSLASIFYAIGHGLSDFHSHFGLFFILMLFAVVLPCTLSDVVVPIIYARLVQEK